LKLIIDAEKSIETQTQFSEWNFVQYDEISK
jgi:hypothetical protein